jgi:quercetin dioxygenase-like cupin family protein
MIVDCPSNGPCVTATWLTGASRVRVGGQPVVVATGQAICAPTGAPLLVVASQSRVTAI